MIPEEYLRRIRQIDVKTRHLADDLFVGEYHSVFKGRGMDFEEVREYSDGDDMRQIHWNVTARTGVPHIKVYREEREMTVNLMIDVSASGELASGVQSKRELAAEIGACLAYSAIRNRDRVGLLLFSDHVEKHVVPGKGRDHILRLIRDILYTQPVKPGTSVRAALEYFYHVQVRRSVLIVISDFMDDDYVQALRVVAKTHDVIPIVVEDARERDLADAGWILVQDAETGELLEVNSGDPKVRAKYAAAYARRQAERAALFKSAGVTAIEARTNEPFALPLRRFFQSRMQARGAA